METEIVVRLEACAHSRVGVTHMKSSAMQEHFMRRLFYRGYNETITIALCLQLLDLGIK